MTSDTNREQQIKDCMAQLTDKRKITHAPDIEAHARMRLADFSAVLAEWEIDLGSQPERRPLPDVAALIKNPKPSPADVQKLLGFLQQQAKQGQQTAILYLSYLYAKGIHLPQSLQKAASAARMVAQQGDWRGSRFLGELLCTSPKAAPLLLGAEIQAAATAWQQEHPETEADKIQAAAKRFLENETAVRYAARLQFETATRQGSPTAQQRMRGLCINGQLPDGQPAKHLRSPKDWLDNELLTPGIHIDTGDPDITVLPENIPLFVQQDEEPSVWRKTILIAAGMFAFVLLTVIMTKAFL